MPGRLIHRLVTAPSLNALRSSLQANVQATRLSPRHDTFAWSKLLPKSSQHCIFLIPSNDKLCAWCGACCTDATRAKAKIPCSDQNLTLWIDNVSPMLLKLQLTAASFR